MFGLILGGLEVLRWMGADDAFNQCSRWSFIYHFHRDHLFWKEVRVPNACGVNCRMLASSSKVFGLVFAFRSPRLLCDDHRRVLWTQTGLITLSTLTGCAAVMVYNFTRSVYHLIQCLYSAHYARQASAQSTVFIDEIGIFRARC
jgi:hypothetical protein